MWLPYKILCVILHILTLPLSLLLFLVLVLYKLVVVSLARSFHDFEGSVPSSNCIYLLDCIWSKPSTTIIVAIELQGNFSKETLTTDFQRAYDIRDEKGRRCYRELGYHLAFFMGHGFWKKIPNFQIADRVKVVKIDKKLSTLNAKEYLTETVQRLQRKPFKENEPLWDANLLLNYNGDPNQTVMIWRYHHALADGMSIVKLFYAMTGSQQLPESFTKPCASISTWQHYASSLLAKTAFFAKLCTVGIVDYLDALVFHQDKTVLNFDRNGNFKGTGEWRCSMGDKISVEKLKTASRHYKCSIVHLILAGVSNGVDRYMAKYHGDGEEENFDKGFYYVAPIPVPGHPNLRLVNHWCVAKFYSRPGIQQTFYRIEYFKEEALRGVSSSLPITSAMVLKYCCGVLPATVSKCLIRTKASSTVALSNVVGPQDEERLLGGCKLTNMVFWLPILWESMALTVAVISCNGGLCVCLTADQGCIPGRSRLDDLTGMITEELLEICKMSPL